MRALVIDWSGNSFPWTVALDRNGDPPRELKIGAHRAYLEISEAPADDRSMDGNRRLTYRAVVPLRGGK